MPGQASLEIPAIESERAPEPEPEPEPGLGMESERREVETSQDSDSDSDSDSDPDSDPDPEPEKVVGVRGREAGLGVFQESRAGIALVVGWVSCGGTNVE